MLGQVIHGYRVDRVLSADKGGFGEVFLATHVDSGAEAVVKVLRAEMSANRDMVTRFFNEARAAASIHHPGIVQIHNIGYHGDRAYLLMERLRGDDLETRLKAGPLPLERALVFMRQTAGAIAAAHERGIVHRDLKPANLFIVADPDVAGGERIKVLDFGIAKLTGGATPGMTQGVFGTPMYMSPEQCASTGAVDHRSDLYSLGCIFYELVCGRPPFGRGGMELIASHLRDAPAPPHTIVPAVPQAIEAIILQLLEKDPERRLQSCSALIRALEGAAVASGVSLGPGRSVPPVTAAPTTPDASYAAHTAPTPPRARRTGLYVGGAIVVLAGAAIAIVLATRGGGSDHAVAAAPATPRPVAIDAQVAIAPPPDATAPSEPARDPAREAAERFYDQGKQALLTGKGDFPVAAEYLRESIENAPTAKAYLALATAEYSQGHFGEARHAAEAVAQQQPTDREAQNAAKLITKIDDEIHKQGLDRPKTPAPTPAPPTPSPPTDGDAAALEQRAKDAVFAQPPRFEEALKLFQQAYALQPTPQTLFNIATMQYQLGRCPAAKRSLDRLLAGTIPDRLADKARALQARLGGCS